MTVFRARVWGRLSRSWQRNVSISSCLRWPINDNLNDASKWEFGERHDCWNWQVWFWWSLSDPKRRRRGAHKTWVMEDILEQCRFCTMYVSPCEQKDGILSLGHAAGHVPKLSYSTSATPCNTFCLMGTCLRPNSYNNHCFAYNMRWSVCSWVLLGPLIFQKWPFNILSRWWRSSRNDVMLAIILPLHLLKGYSLVGENRL